MIGRDVSDPISGEIRLKHIMTLTKPTALAVSLILSSIALAGCSSIGIASNPLKGDSIDTSSNVNYRSHNRIKRHIYAGIGVGPSWMEPDASEIPTADVNDRYETGGQVTLGMDLSRQVAVELHSADLGSAGITPTSRVNYHILGASALLYAGKNRHNFKRKGLSGFGRVGVGLLDNTVDGDVEFVKDNGAHLLIGAGLEYMTRVGLGIRAEAISFEEDARYAQLALVYRTGKQQSARPVEIVKAPEPAPMPIAVPAIVVAEKVIVPIEPVVDTCSEFSGSLDGVNFHSNSANLTVEATAVLDDVANRLNECASVPVQISAHTDSMGDEAYNQNLSEQRADSVSNYLRNRGIDGERLQAEAFGESQPIDTNETNEGRSRNRRVELITLQ